MSNVGSETHSGGWVSIDGVEVWRDRTYDVLAMLYQEIIQRGGAGANGSRYNEAKRSYDSLVERGFLSE